MGGPPPAITSNQNNFLGPVAACWAPGASVEVFLRLGGHFGVPPVRGQWAYYRKCAPEDVFKNSNRKNFRVTRWWRRAPRGRQPPSASRNATYRVLSGIETETDASRHGIKYVYRTSIVFKEAPARPRRRPRRQHGHDDDHHHHHHNTKSEDCGSSEQSESESDADNEIQFV